MLRNTHRTNRRRAVLAMALVAFACAARGGEGDATSATEQRGDSVPIQTQYGRTVVYGTDPKVPIERLRADCAARGGSFNTCGSLCPPGEICATVCAYTCENTRSKDASAPARSTTGEIALLDTSAATPTHGCDAVRTIERPLPAADDPVEARLRALFAIEQPRLDGLYNFIARTRETLTLDDVRVENGTARVYLSGRISNLAGACDHPRARIQIEETARRVEGVTRVEIFLNGKPSDLQPDVRK